MKTLSPRSPQNVESNDSVTECESDTEEEQHVSENDLEIPGEQSHTVGTGNTNSTCTVSGRTEAPVEKAQIMLTENQQTFVKMFQLAVSKIDKPWKIEVRHVLGRGVSLLVNGIFQEKKLLQSIIDHS